MSTSIRIATFNLENFDDQRPPKPSTPTFAERLALMRPQIGRLRADILCLQEVSGQEDHGHYGLRALDALLAETTYAGFNRVTTAQVSPPVVPEDVAPVVDTSLAPERRRSVAHERNLVVLARFNVLEARQVKHIFAPAPSYRKMTADPPEGQAQSLTWERPILHVKLQINGGRTLHIINVHLKSKLPATIKGQKIHPVGLSYEAWRSASGWAEGSFIAVMQRVGQALEVRRLIDALFDQDERALIALIGDCNATSDDVPLAAIRGDVEDTDNPELAARVMVPCEHSVPEPARYSLLHHGKGQMLDHIVVSRPLLEYYRGTEIHNELLHDKSSAFATDKKFPESDHAPVIAAFELP